MYCDIFASGLLFTESLKPQKRFEINLPNAAITTTGIKVASYCFLKSGGNANICTLKYFPWIGRGDAAYM